MKLRTPESDSSNQDDVQHTLKITVTDALCIRTKKSLIPIRITSLPTSPRKRLPVNSEKRLHKSTPNLSKTGGRSKIPLKKEIVSNQISLSSVERPDGKYNFVFMMNISMPISSCLKHSSDCQILNITAY